MVDESITEQFLSAGKNLTPLEGKKPIMSNWTKKKVSEDWIYAHAGNLGWVIGPGDLVIDIDPRNGGTEGFERLQKHLQIVDPDFVLEPTVKTPNGGYHIYMQIPQKYEDNKFKRALNKDYPGVEFITQGGKCVIPSSTTENGEYEWYDDMLGAFEQTMAPDALINLIAYTVESNEDIGDFEGLLGGDSSTWTEKKVNLMLAKLDPSMPNNDWVRVGMALHDWDPINGLHFWEEWSKGGENYQKRETAKRWKSFDSNQGVTLGTISHMVKEVKYDEEIDLCNRFIEDINRADEKTLQFDIIKKIRKKRFSKINLEKLAIAVQQKMTHLTGVKMPISNIRKSIKKPNVVQGMFIDFEKAPDWCKRYVYVNSHAGFIDLSNFVLHKPESFNIMNGKYVPLSESGTKPSATKWVSDRGFAKVVDTMGYFPTVSDVICNLDDGTSILNTFNSRTLPHTAEKFTKSGRKAIEAVESHIKFICTTDENAHILTQWLAHQIQFPGKQVMWAPVIQSIEGVGKSFFGELMRACLGDKNVGTIAPTQAVSDFNGWATNVVVNILEELRVRGHNRHETVNALKPLITDRMIQINDKGVKQYTTYNTTNYMCFTNYKDCLPLHENDRRWWIIFVPLLNLKHLKKYVGEHADTYFPRMFDSIYNNRHELRKWLLEYPITPEFLNTKRAPMTEHKLAMIATEEASIEGLQELKQLVDEGGEFYNQHVICSNDLFNALAFKDTDLVFRGAQRNFLLKKLGYMALPSPVSYKGKTRRVWTREAMSTFRAMRILDNPNLDEKGLLVKQEDDEDDDL